MGELCSLGEEDILDHKQVKMPQLLNDLAPIRIRQQRFSPRMKRAFIFPWAMPFIISIRVIPGRERGDVPGLFKFRADGLIIHPL